MSEARSTAAATPIDRELRVASAAEQWAEQVAGLGGRDPLLYFRDLKVGTLDLAAADPDGRRRLLDGEPVAVSKLFPHEPLRSSAIRSTRALLAKIRELAEERGLRAAYLAIGVATWADPRAARRPGVPVLLRAVSVTPRNAAESDFVIEASVHAEVNPMLLRAMAVDLGIRIAPDDLLDPAGELRYVHVVERLREFAPPHVADGFGIAHRVVISSFSTAKISLLDELRHSARAMAGHDVIAALADDRLALVALRERQAQPTTGEADLVLDADTDQAAVISDVLAGSNLAVQAPPGTGATQTTANLVAALVADGKRVLYVCQKRTAIESLVERLDRLDLADLVLDTQDRPRRQHGIARTVLETIRRLSESASEAGDQVDDDFGRADQQRLAELATMLQAHRDAAHAPRAPWGISLYQAEAAVSATPDRARTGVRLPAAVLAGLYGDALERAREAMREYAELGGLTLNSASPWHGAHVRSREEAEVVGRALHQLLHDSLFACRDATTRAAVEVGLPGPHTPTEAESRTRLLAGVAETLEQLRPQVWSAPLDEFVAATGSAATRREIGVTPSWWTRRKLRRAARSLLRDPAQLRGRDHLHHLLAAAHDQLLEWRRLSRDGRRPRVGEHVAAAVTAVAEMRTSLDLVAAVLPDGEDLAGLAYADLSRRLVALAADQATLDKVPRLIELYERLLAGGLADLIGELRQRSVDPLTAVAALDHVWYSSLLDQWRAGGIPMESFDAAVHDEHVAAYRSVDRLRLSVTASRLRRSHQLRVASLADEFPDQMALLAAEADKDDWQLPAPDLVQVSRDVLLSAKPCWVVSPLVVSQVLPTERLFDVVVIDEASQLPWIHAIPAIARAAQVVIFGDQRHLPPQPFFVSAVADEVLDNPTAPIPTAPPASALDKLAPLLPVRSLSRHYRSRDERLIAFANRYFYNDRLKTLPGATTEDCIRHVLVNAQPGEGPVDSSTAEVDRVVELAIEHARSRPYESLGIIAFTDKHAERIELALRRALHRAPDVAQFFAADRSERCFVKHLDQVQGDSRDAVIVTLGYGRAADGRVLHRFGPINHEAGVQRLAVALTRARTRLSVVSCFTADELVPWRLNSDGAQALRDFLDFAVSGGQLKPIDLETPRDAVREAVADRLGAVGLEVLSEYGRSATRVGLALRHPRRDDRFLLAIETDGPDYAALPSVRERDRLYPEWLERLGWRVHRVWGAAWSADPDREIDRIRAAYERALQEADEFDAAVNAATADAVAGLPGSETSKDGAGESKANQARTPIRPAPSSRPPADALIDRRPIWAYSLRELVWVVKRLQAEGARTERQMMAAVLGELGLDAADPRVEGRVRQAVRTALITRKTPKQQKGAGARKNQPASQAARD